MFSSFFSTAPPADPHAPNFHPVSSGRPSSELFGELEPKDIEWTCPGGFAVETQTFYFFLEDGTVLTFQVIHSAVGLWYPTIQVTFKQYNPVTGEKIWKSTNVTNFVTPPPGHDKRSSKGDQFSITHKSNPGSDQPEGYTIRANYDNELQISLDVSRPAGVPGFKVGKGPKGGFSYFGPDLANPEGYVVHRFWPCTTAKGLIIYKGKALDAAGSGMMVHAIQGMRPNLVAARWNFAYFQSSAPGGASAVQMDFTTTDAYGKKGAGSGFVTVNVGAVVLDNKLVAVTAETKWPGEPQPDAAEVVSRATHSRTAQDADTGYAAPTEVIYRWAAPVIGGAQGEAVDATLQVDVGPPNAYKGLVEKVDVLAEIPYVIKTMVNYVAGTKPYIYQWFNPATLHVTGPDSLVAGLSQGQNFEGRVYNEATFIS